MHIISDKGKTTPAFSAKVGTALAVAFCAIPLVAALGGIFYSIPDTPRAQRAAAAEAAQQAKLAQAAALAAGGGHAARWSAGACRAGHPAHGTELCATGLAGQ